MPHLIVHCRCCASQLRIETQPALTANTNPTHLYTCDNPFCAMSRQTIDERDYATVDLNRYVVSRAVAGAGQVSR